MLRAWVLLLVLANAVYGGWALGHFKALGWAPLDPSEPQRMGQQIRSEDLRILGRDEAKRADTLASTSNRQCLVSALLDETQSKAIMATLEGTVPPESWRLENSVQAARWIIYMGKYDSPDAVTRKRAELRALNVNSEPLKNASLEPGLSLGGYDTQAAATAALNQLAQRGVRTARVLQERPEVRGYLLYLPQADDSLRATLDSLKPFLGGKSLQSCAPGSAG